MPTVVRPHSLRLYGQTKHVGFHLVRDLEMAGNSTHSGSLSAPLLRRPTYLVEFKCRSLDTLSSGGRHFHLMPFDQTLARPHKSQACRSSDFRFAHELERSTVDGRLGTLQCSSAART